MPDSSGVNAATGAPLTDWAHTEQSIADILTTRIGSRVMRREYGSELPDLVGKPMNDAIILAVYAATANALARWEPRFELTFAAVEPSADGTLRVALRGTYRPRGHLGDFTVAGNATTYTTRIVVR